MVRFFCNSECGAEFRRLIRIKEVFRLSPSEKRLREKLLKRYGGINVEKEVEE